MPQKQKSAPEIRLSPIDFTSQGESVQRLIRSFAVKNIVHAYLLTGDAGLGKKSLARLLAQSLFCENSDKAPCGECGECARILAGTHPDYFELVPTKTKQLSVEDVRNFQEKIAVKSYEGGWRAIIIPNGDSMTPQAQNALLKTLENPPEKNVFIVCACRSSSLLPTVLSRLRSIALLPYPLAAFVSQLSRRSIGEREAKKVYAVSGGSIGTAIAMLSDSDYMPLRDQISLSIPKLSSARDIASLSLALKERKNDSDIIFSLIEQTIRTPLLAQSGSSDARELMLDYPLDWQKAAREERESSFVKMLEAVMEARKQSVSNVTFQAVLESLFYIISEEHNSWQR
ncbi:MAG: DNA polymerase III subunit [Eubacteriales bacterium]|nr:DNA polymerase III subunit [Eubacteriales bacterium]MDD3882729.1 DNA polymerase III subunit [Eubacteriales bacterium]MDD4512650.1 DNA polymerase III subunit [Eubacteriales bacterium]